MESTNLYDPALIKRDENGQFWHRDLPFPGEESDDDTDLAAALKQQGFVYDRVLGEDYPDEDGGDEYWQWLREWQPAPPEGSGWLLACIADTEDGPAAWFVRPIGDAA